MTTEELAQLIHAICSDVTTTSEKIISKILEKVQIIPDRIIMDKLKEEIRDYRFKAKSLYETALSINKLLDVKTDCKAAYRLNLLQKAIDELIKQRP